MSADCRKYFFSCRAGHFLAISLQRVELTVPKDGEVPNTQLERAVGALRVAMLANRAGPSDTELLEQFRNLRNEEAFAALVCRHGRAVLACCRQVLLDPADIDDAFQATFLVLFRKIQIVDGATLRGWLQAVAHRVAVHARSDARRRAERERTAAERREVEICPPDLSWRETVAILHEELDKLPEAYRRVLLLCYLYGQSRDEAAANLGWSAGAVKGCLERGRQKLASRLARRGIGLSAGILAAMKVDSTLAGSPSWSLINITVRTAGGMTKPAVAALASGAFPMAATAWKFLAGVAIAGGIAVSASMGHDCDDPLPAIPAAAVIRVSHQEAPPDRLATVLEEWEKAENAVKDVRKDIRKTTEEVFRQKTILHVEVLGQKPKLLRCKIEDEQGHPVQTLVCTKDGWHEFDFHSHTERIYPPQLFSGNGGEEAIFFGRSLFRFESGMQMNQWIWLGFDVALLRQKAELKFIKEDQHYIYLEARAKKPVNPDKQEYWSLIQIALFKPNYQTRMVIVSEADGSKTTWDIRKSETNSTPVTEKMIQTRLLRGWEIHDYRRVKH